MKGEELKMKLTKSGHSITEVAKLLGTSQQNLSQALTAQDVKTGLLEKISSALGLPISYFFDKNDPSSAASVSGDFSAASVHGNASVDASGAAVLKERVKALEALLAEKERTIKILLDRA